MDEGDEKAANRVLQSVGLPDLPAVENASASVGVPADAGPDEIQVSHPSLVPDGSSGELQQLDMQLQVSPTVRFLESSFQNDTSMAESAVSLADWSQSYLDDSTTPDWLWAGMLAPDMNIQDSWTEFGLPSNPTVVPNGEDSQPYDDADPEIVNQIAARFGSLQLAPDGKLRYFGTPANAHVLNSNRPWVPSTAQRSLKFDGLRLLRSAELDLEIGRDFEEHLTNVFFSWHNSCHPVVDEDMYRSAKNGRDGSDENSGFCSEVLTSAM